MEDKSTENIQTKVWREIKMYNTYKSNIHVIQVLVDMRERMNKSNIKKKIMAKNFTKLKKTSCYKLFKPEQDKYNIKNK